MRRPSTTLASKAQALVRYGEALGIERGGLLSAARLSPGAIERGDGRVATASMVTLWADLARCTGDPDLGLNLAESEATSSAFGVVGFRAMTSGTLGEALACFVRYSGVINEHAEARVAEAADALTFEQALPVSPDSTGRLMADRTLASCLLLARRWTGELLRPRRIRLRHGRPRDTSGYERLFDCAVDFDQPTDAIVFDRATATLPLRTAQADVAGFLETLASTARADLPQDDAGRAVADAVRALLAGGDPGLRAVARKLGVSARTLQRRLLSEGLSYHGIVDQVRRELAVGLVTSTTLPLAIIGERVGYAEDRAFRRAFRRWTGASPAALRRDA